MAVTFEPGAIIEITWGGQLTAEARPVTLVMTTTEFDIGFQVYILAKLWFEGEKNFRFVVFQVYISKIFKFYSSLFVI